MELMPHQKEAIEKLDNGKILWGDVGSGKTAAALGYYIAKESPKDIYVITTAKKRDSLDWVSEATKFGIGSNGLTLHGELTVDSWNNISKYTDVDGAFFIFDEQRLVGHGAWVKAFLKIAKKNRWILLSGTPGDIWLDYAPIFIANGWYKNITDFKLQHVLYEPFSKYPKIRMYLKTELLERLRNSVLVEMPFLRHTERVLNYMDVSHDAELFKRAYKDRWNVYEDRPIKDIAELFRVMRKIVNSDPSRLELVKKLLRSHPRLIVFYNFNYELEILRSLNGYILDGEEVVVGEWNGHRKDPVPDSPRWVYLVQYVAGAEGWNCTSTNAEVFYSLTYSYKNFEQAQGRIDRLNTDFKTLYYYIFVSNSVIDRSIKRSLDTKERFYPVKFMSSLDKGELEL